MSATDKYDIVGGKKKEGRTMRISLALQEAAPLSLHCRMALSDVQMGRRRVRA